MAFPRPKFEVGSQHCIAIGDCSGKIKIGAKMYDTIKDTWTYYISGNGSCGKWSEWVNELFLIEHTVTSI